MHSTDAADSVSSRNALWACPFRPFFLLTAAYAIVVILAWLGIWFGSWPLPEMIGPMQWHSHEMLFGVVAAAIAGFLLTAMCAWTGARPLSGAGLILLTLLWLAGRATMLAAEWLPWGLVSAVNLAFLPVVAVYAARVIVAAGSHRNLLVIGVIGALWVTQLLFHAGLWSVESLLTRRAELAAIMLVVLLMIIIGGRITPAFTRNWLIRRGANPERVRTHSLIETAVLVSSMLLFVMVLAGAPDGLVGLTALLAGTANLVRLAGWSGWLTWRDPLMWILHAGYAWIPIGLLLMGLSPWLASVPDTAWLHALGTGAMGVLIVGVMTRVSLGHTGRELRLPRAAIAVYGLILLAALVRVGAGLGVVAHQPGILIASLAWMGAFTVFLLVYAPILWRPRADGKPG